VRVIRQQKYIHELSASFFENTKACKNKKKKNNKKTTTSQDFLVKGWSVEGHVIKVVEHIVMDFGLLILHKTKVLIL